MRGLDRFLSSAGMPRTAPDLHREHVEAFITELLSRWTPATAHNRYRALRSFFGWLVEEGEIATSPMVRLKPPRLPETPPPVLREPELRRLLNVCERDRTPANRRDEAILRIFMDTGARRGEVLGLSLDDVDLDLGLLRVTEKRDRKRSVAIGAHTVRALDRHVRSRAKSADAARFSRAGTARGHAGPKNVTCSRRRTRPTDRGSESASRRGLWCSWSRRTATVRSPRACTSRSTT
ncbi:MAG: tyrosine-type recombinase/integrase [Chloroflexi bacterium]|nr:tyrosine-type recombinase/integrase [Chloroflexota bacterium]